MFSIDWTIWLILFAPAMFAFVVGGGYWYHCYSTTSSIEDAAEKFKIYTWLVLPVASVIYLIIVYLATSAEDLETLRAGAKFEPLIIAAAVGFGLLLALAAIYAMKSLFKQSSEEMNAFLTPEFRELPGLVVVAPLAEEFVFRGYGSVVLDDLSLPVAALITSIAFALIHYKPVQMVYAFIVGIAFFALFHATDNLLAPMIAHSITNLSLWIWMRRSATSSKMSTSA